MFYNRKDPDDGDHLAGEVGPYDPAANPFCLLLSPRWVRGYNRGTARRLYPPPPAPHPPRVHQEHEGFVFTFNRGIWASAVS